MEPWLHYGIVGVDSSKDCVDAEELPLEYFLAYDSCKDLSFCELTQSI